MHRIRAISLDVGGTLLEPWPSVGQVYAQVAQELGFSGLDPSRLTAQFLAGWKQNSGFAYSRAEWRELVCHSFAGCCPVDDRLFSAIYDRFAHPAAWRVFPDVRATLEEMKSRGVKLTVLSNWDERLRPLLKELELASLFDAQVISAEVGFHKPDAEIFAAARAALAEEPGQILHIGDSAREDLQGALQAGWQAALIDRSGEDKDSALRNLLSSLSAAARL